MTQPDVLTNADAAWLTSDALAQQRVAAIYRHANLTVPDQRVLAFQAAQARALGTFEPIRSQIGAQPVVGGPMPTTNAAPGASGAASGAPTFDAQNIAASLQATLDAYGLSGLMPRVEEWLAHGYDENAILALAQQTPEWKQRFAGNELLKQQGLTPLSPSEYINYEQTARQLMRQYGVPSGYFDSQQTIAGLIGSNLGLPELQQRIQTEADVVNNGPIAERQALTRLYGITDGDLIARALDAKTALPVLQRKIAAAQAAGYADMASFSPLTQTQAEDVATLNLTPNELQQGFSQAARAQQAFGQALPGEAGYQGLTSDQLIAASLKGDASAQAAIDNAQRRRLAAFGGGGQYAATSQGVTGLGVAQGA